MHVDAPDLPDAYLISPTVFEDVADDAFLSGEEVFGPVTTLYRFASLDDAIERANSVAFGLSASVFTTNRETAQRCVDERLRGSSPGCGPTGPAGCANAGGRAPSRCC